MDWFEVISENFMVAGGRPHETLARLQDSYAVVPHGVSLAVGSVEPLDEEHLRQLRALCDRIDPPWVSDHLCWGRAPGVHLHDLLPLPYTREAIDHVVERVKRVQGTLERPFALENVSTYMAYRDSTMQEWEFVAEIAERADCGLLLDCNKAYVSARNHDGDAARHIDAMPADRVVQIHLAGHTDKGATSSTRMPTTSARTSGTSTAAPSRAADRSPRSWSGTTPFRAGTCSPARPSAPRRSAPRCSRR